ncbi:type II secretion system major pseudopilin GspG [Rheinheimera maricola]|uniref:Type II secretion system core protein G n=1 Tax=Rheinheimera maricola TaxID=2793282 RepID=A0ABS7X4P6_9GAMM|nr:type II secretion system major pseudopilin GspG [Rheinheimera maricola]MBZ9610281.1 type II secretion system major pseudopilin GspG [Rheinheimera maricola]
MLSQRVIKSSVRRGFTLIELLIVMVILGLLASLVAPEMFSKVDSSQRKTATAQMQMLQTAISAYRLDTGTYPASLSELRQSEHARWDGPYLPKDVPLDPWGNAYIYRFPGSGSAAYDLLSYAADGREGGEELNADIFVE